jgi:hypothetical protein
MACLIASVAVLVGLINGGDERLVEWGVSACASVAGVFLWWRVVTQEWVRRASELYADRLFEAVDSLRQDVRADSHDG